MTGDSLSSRQIILANNNEGSFNLFSAVIDKTFRLNAGEVIQKPEDLDESVFQLAQLIGKEMARG